jgi:PAS domain-containing protein
MNSTACQPIAVPWLAEHGPKELEQLFRAVLFQPAAPILLADSDRNYREASAGASKLLGLPREKIIGGKLDEFAEPSSQASIPERWRAWWTTPGGRVLRQRKCPSGASSFDPA